MKKFILTTAAVMALSSGAANADYLRTEAQLAFDKNNNVFMLTRYGNQRGNPDSRFTGGGDALDTGFTGSSAGHADVRTTTTPRFDLKVRATISGNGWFWDGSRDDSYWVVSEYRPHTDNDFRGGANPSMDEAGNSFRIERFDVFAGRDRASSRPFRNTDGDLALSGGRVTGGTVTRTGWYDSKWDGIYYQVTDWNGADYRYTPQPLVGYTIVNNEVREVRLHTCDPRDAGVADGGQYPHVKYVTERAGLSGWSNVGLQYSCERVKTMPFGNHDQDYRELYPDRRLYNPNEAGRARAEATLPDIVRNRNWSGGDWAGIVYTQIGSVDPGIEFVRTVADYTNAEAVAESIDQLGYYRLTDSTYLHVTTDNRPEEGYDARVPYELGWAVRAGEVVEVEAYWRAVGTAPGGSTVYIPYYRDTNNGWNRFSIGTAHNINRDALKENRNHGSTYRFFNSREDAERFLNPLDTPDGDPTVITFTYQLTNEVTRYNVQWYNAVGDRDHDTYSIINYNGDFYSTRDIVVGGYRHLTSTRYFHVLSQHSSTPPASGENNDTPDGESGTWTVGDNTFDYQFYTIVDERDTDKGTPRDDQRYELDHITGDGYWKRSDTQYIEVTNFRELPNQPDRRIGSEEPLVVEIGSPSVDTTYNVQWYSVVGTRDVTPEEIGGQDIPPHVGDGRSHSPQNEVPLVVGNYYYLPGEAFSHYFEVISIPVPNDDIHQPDLSASASNDHGTFDYEIYLRVGLADTDKGDLHQSESGYDFSEITGDGYWQGAGRIYIKVTGFVAASTQTETENTADEFVGQQPLYTNDHGSFSGLIYNVGEAPDESHDDIRNDQVYTLDDIDRNGYYKTNENGRYLDVNDFVATVNENSNSAEDYGSYVVVRQEGGDVEVIEEGTPEGGETTTRVIQGAVQGGEVSDNSASKPKYLITNTTATYRMDVTETTVGAVTRTDIVRTSAVVEIRSQPRRVRITDDNGQLIRYEDAASDISREVITPETTGPVTVTINPGRTTRSEPYRVEITEASSTRVINPAWIAARDALKGQLKNDIKSGQKLTGDFGNFVLVINTTTAGVEFREEYVVAKSSKDRLVITPRIGAGGIGKDYKYVSAGVELGYETKEIRDLLIKLGYDTGTHFEFRGKHDGFKVDGKGDTGDYGFVEVTQGAPGEIKVTVRADTKKDWKLGLSKGPYSASVNQDGQVEAKYTIQF